MQKLSKLFSLFYKYLLTAILIVVPLFQKFPAIRIPGIYVAIRLEDFLILATVLFFLVLISKNFKESFQDRPSRAIILFLVIGFISTLSSIYLTQSTTITISLLHFFRRVEYLSLFFVGFLYIKEIKDNNFADYLLKVLLLVNFLVFIYGLGQRYLNLPVIITQNEEYSKGVALRWIPGSHINSTFAGHYDLASYLVLTIPFFVTAFFTIKDKISKLILFLSTILGFWLFSVAVSRISILAFLIATTVSLFLLKKYKEIFIVGFISVLVFGLSPDLRARYIRIIDVVKQKIVSSIVVYAEDGNVNEDRSTSIRLNVEWPRAIRAFLKNPILGTGYSSITLATDNDYLRALGETGFLGLFAFILIFVNLFLKFSEYNFNLNLESAFVASFIGSTIGILVTAIFIDIFEASKFATTYWLLSGLVLGIINKYEQNI